MTSESQPHQNPVAPNIPPPPLTRSNRKRPRRKKKLLITSLSAVVALALIGGGAGIAYSNNSEKLEAYDDALDTLSATQQASAETLDDARELEPGLQEELENHLSDANALLEADAPGIMSFSIEDRTAELQASNTALSEPRKALREAIDLREAYTTAKSEAAGVLQDAEKLLKKTKNKVDDKDAYKALSGHVTTLDEAIEETPDETSGRAFADTANVIEEASSNISESSPVVSASHERWKDAKEEAAKRDPANYKTLSERDWQLVQRNPDAHEGEKYIVYGAVTQADANMGEISIRLNTGATKQSRRYNYDVNTVALVGTADIFSDVVQDDHVKMLVEVGGSMTYDTTIGGSATAVMVLAYDVEVLGQF